MAQPWLAVGMAEQQHLAAREGGKLKINKLAFY